MTTLQSILEINDINECIHQLQTVYFFGTIGKERYRLFAMLMDEPWKSFLLQDRFSGKPDYTIIFFPDDYCQAFFEVNNGNLMVFNPSIEMDSLSMKVCYFPIHSSLIPNGFIYIFPPPLDMDDYLHWTEKLITETSGNMQKLFWVQPFPYIRNESVLWIQQVRNNPELARVDLNVCLLKTGRHFGSTDISDELAALKFATEEYASRNLCDFIHVIEDGFDKNTLRSLLFEQRPYKEKIVGQVKGEIQFCRQHFQNYFDSDYEVLSSEECLAVSKIDDIFSYDRWKKWPGDHPMDCWIHYLKEKLIIEWQELCSKFVMDIIKPVILTDPRAELEAQLEGKFKSLIDKAATYRQSIKSLSKSLDNLDYLIAIGNHKAHIKQIVVQFFQIEMRNFIQQYISSQFQSWDKWRYINKGDNE